ncbi:MAG: formylglycine-generating enzyme family protein [Spirochaetes bacterium]|nr:formylglycine-generating enzyme family protein [Spirochaetota bacterium]
MKKKKNAGLLAAIAALAGLAVMACSWYAAELPPPPPAFESMVDHVWIPGGTFTMGSPEEEGGNTNERPQRQVTISQGFWMGVYPVTRGQWEAVMGSDPSWHTGNPAAGETGLRPVTNVSWYDALVFANRLSVMDGLEPAYSINGSTDPDSEEWGTVPTANNAAWNAVLVVEGSNGWRLPTEAQWEFAARAGTETAFSNGVDVDDWSNLDPEVESSIREIAWFAGAPGGNMTRQVGQLAANGNGLHDMHGNVWEWVWDRSGTYPAQAQTDPQGASSGSFRVSRGGSCFLSAQSARSAVRGSVNPFGRSSEQGVRLVRP